MRRQGACGYLLFPCVSEQIVYAHGSCLPSVPLVILPSSTPTSEP